MITTAQAAVILKISRSRVLKLIEAKRLPAEKLGRDWLIQPRDIELVRERRTGRPGKTELDAETAAMSADQALMAALTAQDERLAAVVTAVHVDGATLAEVAARLGVSRERARQLRAQGLRRLRGIATGLE